MPLKTITIRVPAETIDEVQLLRLRWSGPAAQATQSQVIREAIRRAVDAEKKSAKKA